MSGGRAWGNILGRRELYTGVGCENIRTFAFQGRMLGPETVCFLLFGGFLMYSGSISFRELKNAKKILCLLEGVGAKIILLLKKKNGEEYWSGGRAWRDNLGRRELYTGVGVGAHLALM